MSRSEAEQTGQEYFQENMVGSWQPAGSREKVVVIRSTRPVHMQIIAAGLAVQWNRTVCGIDDITREEWTVTPEDGAELLQKPLLKILGEETGDTKPKMV